MNVIVDGLMVNYQKTGKGKIILMLHGWGDSSATFKLLADRLESSYQIYAIDLPGFGGSQAPDQLWGTEAFAELVRDFVSKLDIKPYAVLGHSFGGAVAMSLASEKPAFEKLVLLASAGRRNKNPLKTNALKAAAKTAKPVFYLLPSSKRSKLKRRIYSSVGSDALLLPQMEKVYRKIITEDMGPAAAKIKLPSLLIYGTKDKATPAADGLFFHRLIKGSDLKVIEAGHHLHQQQPEQVAGLIKDFLDS